MVFETVGPKSYLLATERDIMACMAHYRDTAGHGLDPVELSAFVRKAVHHIGQVTVFVHFKILTLILSGGLRCCR
jgi:hypothetical protein